MWWGDQGRGLGARLAREGEDRARKRGCDCSAVIVSNLYSDKIFRNLDYRMEKEVRYEEFRGQVRDPYPAIGEKAVGRWGRIASVVSITLTLYGGGCVFIVLISQLTGSLMAGAGLHLDLCTWMVIVAAGLTPLTWMGTPKDFWPIAVGALITTIIACILIIINCVLAGEELEARVYPAPTANGFFKGSYFQSL